MDLDDLLDSFDHKPTSKTASDPSSKPQATYKHQKPGLGSQNNADFDDWGDDPTPI